MLCSATDRVSFGQLKDIREVHFRKMPFLILRTVKESVQEILGDDFGQYTRHHRQRQKGAIFCRFTAFRCPFRHNLILCLLSLIASL